MTDPKKYEKAFGLDMPFDEAIQRFANVTKAEIEAEGLPSTELIPEGHEEHVPFKGHNIRKVFHDGEWYFSIIDVVGALTDTTNPNRYWSGLKRQMIENEGFSESYAKIVRLKLPSSDGKSYDTDVADTETLFRIIQSIPSARAEPFKRWLARVGYERIQEIQNPEIAIKRAIMTYQLQGRTDEWIDKRIRTIVARKELTSEWARRGVKKGQEYAVLTNVISTHTFGIGNKDHKKLKGLKSQNLRDHMTDLELIFTMLGEKSTTEIARTRNAHGFSANESAAKAGGTVAGVARTQLEKETGDRVVSRKNFLELEKGTTAPQRLAGPKPKKPVD